MKNAWTDEINWLREDKRVLLEACKGCLSWLSKVTADHDGDETGLSARASKQYEITCTAISAAERRVTP